MGLGGAESRCASGPGPGGCGPGPRCGAASGASEAPGPGAGRFGPSQVRGGGGADRCLPRLGGWPRWPRGGGRGGGGSALAMGTGQREEPNLTNSNKKSQPAPDGRVEGWVFAGEMRGLCLQLAYKVPVLGSQDLPGTRSGRRRSAAAAAARGRSRREAGARPGPAGHRRALLGFPGPPVFPALGPAGAPPTPGSPRAGRGERTEPVLREP